MPDHSPDGPRACAWNTACAEELGEVLPQIDHHLRQLEHQFQAMGLTCDRQVKPTRRGLTTFLAAVGQRGLLFMVEISLLVVVQPAGQRDVMVDATLLDACGDVVAPCITAHRMVPGCRQACCEHILADTDLTRAMTSIYVLAMAHFDLVPVVGRGAQRLLP